MVSVKNRIPQKSIEARGIVLIASSRFRSIYGAVAIPRMLYGLDVCPLDDAGMKNMEQAHRQNAKIIQNLPICTPNPAPLATLGWLSISGQVAIMKLVFMWRILCLPLENIYRKVLIHVLTLALFGGYITRF